MVPIGLSIRINRRYGFARFAHLGSLSMKVVVVGGCGGGGGFDVDEDDVEVDGVVIDVELDQRM